MQTRRPWHRLLYVFAWLWWLALGIGFAPSSTGAGAGWIQLLDVVLGAGMLLALRWRHRAPLAVALVLVLLVPWASTGMWAALWAFATLSTTRDWKRIAVPGVLVLTVLPTVTYLVGTFNKNLVITGPDDPPLWAFALMTWLVWVIPFGSAFGLGVYVGARRDLVHSYQERAALAEERQALMIHKAQADERNRIAREMHDVVAHRISLISMEAGALVYREDLSRDQVRELAEQIQHNSRQALDELRAVLGSLRNVDDDGSLAKPQPTLAQLPALIADVREAGQRIEARIEVDDVPTQLSRHGFRIVQEGLTNARKHAAGASVSVTIDRYNDGLRIQICNPLRVGPATLPGSGQGLIGVRERVEMAGGTFSAGIFEQEFCMKAWMPWPQS